MCGVIGGSGGDTGSWHNVELVAMEDLELDVVMDMADVELDGDMESWVGLVFLDATYWRFQQKEEEELLARYERQGKWFESLWKGGYLQSQYLRSI